MEFNFEVNKETKEEYLETKPTGTAESNAFILRSVDEYEQMIDKPIYNMTHNELKEMRATVFRNTSINSILKNVSILRKYIDYCINKNLVSHRENRLALFTANDAKEEVSKQALSNMYTPKKTIREYQNILYNDQDKLLIELPLVGIIGEDIVNLRIDSIDKNNKTIVLDRDNGESERSIEVDYALIELIEDTFNQEIYIENNGEETDNDRLGRKPRESQINKVENFVFRIPSKTKFKKITLNFLNSRMQRIQEWVDNNYLTYNTIYNSGILENLFDIYKVKGDVLQEDFINVCSLYECSISKQQDIKRMFNQYKEILEWL